MTPPGVRVRIEEASVDLKIKDEWERRLVESVSNPYNKIKKKTYFNRK